MLNLSFANDINSQIKFNIISDNKDFFWLKNNNFGKDVQQSSFDYYLFKQNKKTTFQLNLSSGYINETLGFGETYLKYNFNDNSFVKIGKYYRDFSLYQNDNLSSGSMLVSNNAKPMPKIGLVFKLPFKKNHKIDFDLGISHGFFDKNSFYKDAPYLHEKFLYLNIYYKNSQFSAGFVHEAIWAGTTTELGSVNNPGNQPDSFEDFLKVFIAADGQLIDGEPHANALGAHSGIWDFNYIKETSDWKIKLYYQHYFEDTSSLRFANRIDGLWGIELINLNKNSTILLEYLDTTNSFLDPPYQADYYYWNYQYTDGWRYKNQILGNPKVSFPDDKKRVELVKVVNVGINHQTDSYDFELKAIKNINMNGKIDYKLSMQKNLNNYLKYKILLIGAGSENILGIETSISF